MKHLLNEQRLSLVQAARRVGVNPSTAWRWALHGVRGVRLESFSIGAKRFTTSESLERFTEACSAAANRERPQPRTTRQRSRDFQQAEHELDRAGI